MCTKGSYIQVMPHAKRRHTQIKMTKHLTFILLTIGLISCAPTFDKNEKVKSGEIEIRWLDRLTGDFSFTKNWD